MSVSVWVTNHSEDPSTCYRIMKSFKTSSYLVLNCRFHSKLMDTPSAFSELHLPFEEEQQPISVPEGRMRG